jgi:tetratricopeptide (TPR) repeat protein
MSDFSDKPDWEINVKNGIDLLVKLANETKLATPNWPDIKDIYYSLNVLYINHNEIDNAENLTKKGLDAHPDDITLLRYQSFIYLAKGDIKRALTSAEKIESVTSKSEDLFALPLIHILNNDRNSEYICNKYLAEDHNDNDFIRLWEYYYLLKNGFESKGKEMLKTRWAQIDSSSWQKRLNSEDYKVWGEFWIGCYLKKVDERTFFDLLKDQSTYDNHPLSKYESYREMICDAYFYRALLYATEGNQQKFKESLEKAMSTNVNNFFEYQIAKFFLKEF